MSNRKRPRTSDDAADREELILKRLHAAAEARDNLLAFARFMRPSPAAPADPDQTTWQTARHHRAIADALHKVESGDIKNLMLTMQPRAGKSTLSSHLFVPWYLGRHPEQSVIVATYNDLFAGDHGRAIRDLMLTPQYRLVFPHVDIRSTTVANVKQLITPQGGQAFFVGRGAALSGRGGNCLTGDTLVMTDSGTSPIREMVERIATDAAYRPSVLTMHDGVVQLRPVLAGFRSVAPQPVLRVALGGTRMPHIDATPDHLIETLRGPVATGDLVIGDALIGGQFGATVLSISRIEPDEVFCIQVETGKFFANEILVHNCLIADDLVKDRAEADSQTTRDAIWAWWNAVFRTRAMDDNTRTILSMCMTGETPVLLPDGSSKPLRDVRPGDTIATYRDGELSVSKVLNWANQGPDQIFAIKTASGTVVRANERHPFLVCVGDRLEWVRLRDLRRGQSICRVSGTSGKASSAPKMDALKRPSAEAIVCVTTEKSDGRRVSDHPRGTLNTDATNESKLDTASLTPITNACFKSRAVSVPSASSLPARTSEHIGAASFALITTTHQVASVPCFATTAISPPDTPKHPKPLSLSRLTSDFTLDPIESITPDGVEDVFDIEVADTENFIANGLVSHNTRWHPDDPPGRLLDPKNDYYNEHEARRWHVLNIPALALEKDPLGRKVGEPLWPERFSRDYLENLRRADPRGFQALYQGDPSRGTDKLIHEHWLRPYDAHEFPKKDQIVATICSGDFAVSDAQNRRADKTALFVGSLDNEGILWIHADAFWKKANANEVVEAMINHMRRHRPSHYCVEKGLISKSLMPFLRKRMLEEGVSCSVMEMHPHGDKLARFQSMVARLSLIKVRFPAAPWWQAARQEILDFPGGAHDDVPDSLGIMSTALDMLRYGKQRQLEKADRPKPNTFAWLKELTRRKREEERARNEGF